MKSLFSLYLVIFIGFVGYSLMITVFTPMIMDNQNEILPVSYTSNQRIVWLGILLSLYPLGQFFGSSIIGALSDRYGRRPLLLLTICFAIIFYLLISLSLQFNNFWLLLLFSLLAGLMEANIALAQSAIADVTAEKKRGTYFGYIYLSSSSAFIIGPLVGGKLAAFYNNAIAFWFVTALLIITLIWTSITFKESMTKPQTLRLFDALTNVRKIFTIKYLRKYFLINFLLYLSIFGFFRSYPMYLVNEFHMTVSKLSEFIAWVAVPIIIANLGLTAFFTNRFSIETIVISTGLLTGIFMIIIILPPMQWMLWITLFLSAGALALCLPTSAALISVKAHTNEQGSAMGNNQSLQVGAEAISAILGGLLAAVFVKISLIAFGFLAIAGACLLLFFQTRKS